MRVAQGMHHAGQCVVRFPMIMHGDANDIGQQATPAFG